MVSLSWYQMELALRHRLHLRIRDCIYVLRFQLVFPGGPVSIRLRGKLCTLISTENLHIYNKVRELGDDGWPRWGVDRDGWVLQDLMWDRVVVFVGIVSTRLLRCLDECCLLGGGRFPRGPLPHPAQGPIQGPAPWVTDDARV